MRVDRSRETSANHRRNEQPLSKQQSEPNSSPPSVDGAVGPRLGTDAGPIIPRLNTRLALFEIALFLVAAALGWGVFRTYTALNAFHQRPVPAREIQPAEDIVETLPAAENRNPQDLQEILKL